MIEISHTALLLIDIQMEFAARLEAGVPRSTPDAESNITTLLANCRRLGVEIIHVHHHSLESDSAFRADLPGAAVQPFAAPKDNETLYIKHVNSSFIGTTLETDLHKKQIRNLLVCGGTANHCVETTTRMAGNLGFNVFYLSDCVWAYGSVGPDGYEHSPEIVLSVTLSNLHGEFAEVTDSIQALEKLEQAS